MANPLILLFTFFIIAIVHSANANPCEGDYTTDEEEILKGFDEDKNILAIGTAVVTNIFTKRFKFVSVCEETTWQVRLSICMKVLQHKLKTSRPVSFTVKRNKSNLACRAMFYYQRNNNVGEQDMYICPTTTVEFDREGNENVTTEPQFLIGQCWNATQHRIRVYAINPTSHRSPVSALAQFTGFELDEVDFVETPDGLYTYKPDYDDSGASASVSRAVSREARRKDDYKID